jgi:hypothetical protein
MKIFLKRVSYSGVLGSNSQNLTKQAQPRKTFHLVVNKSIIVKLKCQLNIGNKMIETQISAHSQHFINHSLHLEEHKMIQLVTSRKTYTHKQTVTLMDTLDLKENETTMRKEKGKHPHAAAASA